MKSVDCKQCLYAIKRYANQLMTVTVELLKTNRTKKWKCSCSSLMVDSQTT